MKATIALALVFATTTVSLGFGFSDIENWTGTGVNQAALVVDWNDGGVHESLAWGYRWNGTATGLDLVQAIVDADPRLDAELVAFSFGTAVKGFSYDAEPDGFLTGAGDHQKSGFGFPGEDGYWSYYVGDPDAWNFASTGPSDRPLANGAWDGWSWTPAGERDTTPGIPTPAPVPEPATLATLGLAVLALRRRRK